MQAMDGNIRPFGRVQSGSPQVCAVAIALVANPGDEALNVDVALHTLHAGGGDKAHGFAITAVEGKSDAHTLAVVAADLEAIRAPAVVTFGRGDTAVLLPLLATGVTLEQQPVLAHDPVDPLVVGRCQPTMLLGLAPQDGVNAPVALGGHVGDDGLDTLQHPAIGPRRPATATRRGRVVLDLGLPRKLGDTLIETVRGQGYRQMSSA